LQCGLAGILTGENETFIKQLPDITGMKSEVIIQKSHRYAFDHQLRNTGIKLIEIESRDDLRAAVNERTAMMHFANWLNPDGQIKVDEWVKLAREHNLPCFNDAAADTPPVSRLTEYVKMGYDLVTFSGGKAMRGPQCAGLLLGRKPLIHCALLNMSPFEDVIGRSSKIGKEEIVGMAKAIELFLAADHDALHQEWTKRLELISKTVTCLPSVKTKFYEPEIANHFPTMMVSWDAKKFTKSPDEIAQALRDGRPSITMASENGGLHLTSFLLKPGEDKIVADRLTATLKAHQA
jgi:L-seryl-tRNA(Ser) seleniumtransferase